ncbi:bifunctional diguanylate cyclase/phosphodiesterase [Roseomonas xinghualingensis]|uniref:bifunctional diguanylate cyclase/phosphodiesterase n=1 Tax=Roseomonas xinghualingensis TaxID=2986475 RepID=UPI0021F11D19|nr:EAL domain-containing protein [Roseomonas sp. SXEYE001]MCV4208019.1 EAL domain-containing protein [Roseomonas sp. SXEYE001]
MSLLYRLLLLVTLCAVPLVVLEAWHLIEERREVHAEVSTEAVRMAQLIAGEQRRNVDAARQMLSALSVLRSVRDREAEACSEAMQSVRDRFPLYTALGVADANGRYWCSSLTAGVDISARAGFQQAMATGEFTIGGYVVGPISGAPTLQLFLPMGGEDGHVSGVLSAGLNLDTLAADLAETTLPPGTAVMVLDPHGRVLVDLPRGRQVGQPLPERLRHIMEARAAGSMETEGLHGVRRVIGYVPPSLQPGLGLAVAVGLDHQEAYSHSAQRQARALAISAAGAATALLGACWFAVRFIRRPVSRLVAAAERWRQGDLTARAGLEDGASEMGRLSEAFDAMAEAVAERERRLSDVLQSTTDSVWAVDRNWRCIFNNAHAVAILGGRDLLGKNFWEELPEMVGGQGWAAYQRAMNERVPAQGTFFHAPSRGYFEVNAFPAPDGGVTAFVREVTDQQRVREELRHLAYHDQLTGLANRPGFNESAMRGLVEGGPVALLLIDLDGFKHVNDTLGHAAGDAVLREVAARLADRLGGRGELARLGGDEFAALLPGFGCAAQARALVRELLDALAAEPFAIRGRHFPIRASAGLVLVPAGAGKDFGTLLTNADLALYRAKEAGGGTCQIFEASIREEYEARRLLDEEIGRAVRCGEFELHYQPQMRLADGALVGAEALLRWRHPTRGLLSPGLFLEALEASPHTGAVGAWIIDQACRYVAEWRMTGLDLRIGANLFGEQLRAGDLVGTVEAALARYGLPAEVLELELTENIALRKDPELLAQIRSLRARGVGIAFDDFGTGFASLTTLKDFPLTRLKIDRSFTANLREGTHDAAIVEGVLVLGRSLGLEVIAEGVETEAQEQFLAARGCDEGQGHRYGRAMLPEEFLAAALARG